MPRVRANIPRTATENCQILAAERRHGASIATPERFGVATKPPPARRPRSPAPLAAPARRPPRVSPFPLSANPRLYPGAILELWSRVSPK